MDPTGQNQMMPAMPQPAAPTPAAASPLAGLAKANGMARAMFDNTSKLMAHQQATAKALAGLGKKGDMVTDEDVITAAGDLVAAGHYSAREAAALLATMPARGGEPMAAWVAKHAASNAETMQQLQVMHALSRQELGTSAMRLLAAHGTGEAQAQAQPPSVTVPAAASAPPTNELAPGAMPNG